MNLQLKNYVYMSQEDLDCPIYRVMPVVRFLQILHDQRLTLLRPKKWDDPFENLLLSAEVVLSNGERGSMQTMRESVYGLCWTTIVESDAMWRIYSPNKDGVRLKSTPRKLLTSLESAEGQFAPVTCFIGKVQYHKDQPTLVRALDSLPLFTSDAVGLASSLLHKRNAFSHESEVRLLYLSPKEQASDTYSFPVNPAALFEQAIFDPRMERSIFETYRRVVENGGYPKKIGQSTLYGVPPKLTVSF